MYKRQALPLRPVPTFTPKQLNPFSSIPVNSLKCKLTTDQLVVMQHTLNTRLHRHTMAYSSTPAIQQALKQGQLDGLILSQRRLNTLLLWQKPPLYLVSYCTRDDSYQHFIFLSSCARSSTAFRASSTSGRPLDHSPAKDFKNTLVVCIWVRVLLRCRCCVTGVRQ